MSETEFAYGTYTHGKCGCPSVQAGYEIRGDLENIEDARGPVMFYDQALWVHRGTGTIGTISEDVAKEAWFIAIFRALEEYHTNDDHFALKQAEEGVEIAKELEWI